MKTRLRDHYDSHVVAKLTEEFGYSNQMEVPHLEKIVINVGLGSGKDDPKLLDSVVAEVTRISGGIVDRWQRIEIQGFTHVNTKIFIAANICKFCDQFINCVGR